MDFTGSIKQQYNTFNTVTMDFFAWFLFPPIFARNSKGKNLNQANNYNIQSWTCRWRKSGKNCSWRMCPGQENGDN